MNTMQKMSQTLYRQRLMLQMGIDLQADIDTITLQAMWRQVKNERSAERARAKAEYFNQLENELAA